VTPNQSVQVTDYLTWESCDDSRFNYFDCPPPLPSKNYLPTWVKELSGNLREYLPKGFAQDQTIRHCLGFRGLMDIGYTIPLPENIGGGDTPFCQGRLHPEMIHGTQWARQGGGPWADTTSATGFDPSPYQYRIKLLHWPWRANMAPGWRLLTLPILWDWSEDFNTFSGAQEANLCGSACRWTLPTNAYRRYYNIETVMAIRRDRVVPSGAITFCLVPIYQP
jgi:hypothetical protein